MASRKTAPLDLGGWEPQVAGGDAPVPADSSYAALTAPRPAERLTPIAQTRPFTSGGLTWLSAAAAALLWLAVVGGLAAGVYGLEGLLALAPLQALQLAALAVGPVALIVFCAVLARQASVLALHNNRARLETQRLLDPSLLAASQAGCAVAHIRGEIDSVSVTLDEARAAVLQLSQMIAGESRALQDASAEATGAADRLAAAVATEREQLTATSLALQNEAGAVADAVARQARMVAEAAELAQAQIREAETALSARAADLAAAAGEATDAARAAGGDLSRQTLRLETAARDLNEQVRQMESGLASQRDGLSDLGRSLAGEQESFITRAEMHRLQLSEALSHAREGAGEIGQVSAASGQALQAMVASAAAQVHDLAEAVLIERERIEARARESFGQIGDTVAAERSRIEEDARSAVMSLSAAAEEASRAAEQQARAARDRVEQLNEAAFDAGRQADEAFESRLSAARRVIDQSVALVDQAGVRSGERIQQGLDAAQQSLAALDRALDEIDTRVAALPSTAQQRVEEVRRAVEDGVEALQDAARRAAAETQAIDAAFQERVRRNYEALSEAVRLMGIVASAPAAVAPISGSARRADAEASTEVEPHAPVRETAEPAAADRPPAEDPAAAALDSTTSGEATGAVDMDEEGANEPAPPPVEAVVETEYSLDADQPDAPDEGGPTHDPRTGAEAGLETLQFEPLVLSSVPPVGEDAGLRPTLSADAGPLDDMLEPAGDEPALSEPAAADQDLGEDADESLFADDRGDAPSGGADEAATAASDDWPHATVSEEDEPVDLEALADRLTTELQNMSVDPERLLPRSRVEEIAAPVHAGDIEGARAVTRRLAPAALRRLARRLATDPVLLDDSRRFVRGYAALLRDASRKDRAGYMTTTLLTSEAGRVWLLIDAADS